MASKNMRAGGSVIAFGTIVGTLVGGLFQQPVVGLLMGFGFSVLLAIIFWLIDRRRTG